MHTMWQGHLIQPKGPSMQNRLDHSLHRHRALLGHLSQPQEQQVDKLSRNPSALIWKGRQASQAHTTLLSVAGQPLVRKAAGAKRALLQAGPAAALDQSPPPEMGPVPSPAYFFALPQAPALGPALSPGVDFAPISSTTVLAVQPSNG